MELRSIIDILDSKIEKCLIEEEERAYLYDPYFGIIRNRVNAEYCKGLIRLNRRKDIIQKIINFLLDAQNENGSWNEIHPNYDETSSLVTSIVGDTLLGWYKINQDEVIKESIESAKDYVLSCEVRPGFFIKSSFYYQDHLNVDATCADFLSSYGEYFSDARARKAAENALEHNREHQFDDGVFPYRVNSDIRRSSMNVPCIHYQGVTIYYLTKTLKNLGMGYKDWMQKGVKWLADVQKENGKFDWSNSGLMFAYRLTGAYAFAYSSYNLSRKKNYSKKSVRCLEILNEYIGDLVLRWEKSRIIDMIPSFFSVVKSSNRGNEDFKDFLQKLGYGYYREFSRRRFTENPEEDILFEKINDMFSLHSSTIEPSRNYPDLFMTTECFDCLTYCKVENNL